MASRAFAAVDIGASGGRIMIGLVATDGSTDLHTVHRFANGVAMRDGHLRWNINRLFDEIVLGLQKVARDFPSVESIGIDTWAVDYGLLDADGRLVADPISYRDSRSNGAVELVHDRVPPTMLYSVTGLQFLPFNTLYQLQADRHTPEWQRAAHVVLIPDLLAFWLTGELASERTNASTTGLLDVRTGDWSDELLDALALPRTMFPEVVPSGSVRGRLRPEIASRTGLSSDLVITTVGTHDTASAVAAVPAHDRRFAYVSSGTWSLVGLELDAPVLSPESRAANFSNEIGVDDRIRYLRNVGGLWLLQESIRSWRDHGVAHDLPSLLTEAEMLPSGGPTINVDDATFIPPGDMPVRIAAAVASSGRVPPSTPGEVVRCILDSLAGAYARTVKTAQGLSDWPVDVVHIVGGGSQNRLLCQLTASLSQLPVVAGPVEATALGNVLVQARAHGAVPVALDDLRRSIGATTRDLHRYLPTATARRA